MSKKAYYLGLAVIYGLAMLGLFIGYKIHAAEPEAPTEFMIDEGGTPPATAMSVERNGDVIVAIKVYDVDGTIIAILRPDGTVETDKEPEVAARAFWYALSGYVRDCSKL